MGNLLKRHLKQYAEYRPDKDEIDETVRIAWRFAFGVMQPASVNDKPHLACKCASPDLLMADCEWHGNQAQRICLGK